MKKVFLISSLFLVSCFTVCEKVEALNTLGNMLKKNNTDSSETPQNAFQEISKLTESINVSLDGIIKENISSGIDVPLLSGLQFFIKNISVFFGRLGIKFNKLQSDIKEIKQAQEDEDGEKLASAKELAKKRVRSLLGNSMNAIIANTKASATIYLKLIEGVNFSSIGVNTLEQDMHNLSGLCTKIVKTKRFLREIVEETCKTVGENLEEPLEEKLNQLMADITSFVEVMQKINAYLSEQGLPEGVTSELLEKCSLADKSEETNSDESESESSDESAEQSEEEEEEEEDAAAKKLKKKKKKAKKEELASSEEENADEQPESPKKKKKKKKKK